MHGVAIASKLPIEELDPTRFARAAKRAFSG
jgi:hypothetical protein